jgi:hypothetical protein
MCCMRFSTIFVLIREVRLAVVLDFRPKRGRAGYTNEESCCCPSQIQNRRERRGKLYGLGNLAEAGWMGLALRLRDLLFLFD